MTEYQVLIVDDHPLYLAGIAEVLRELRPDAQISKAHDGAAARAAFREANFDLIALDLELPDTTGHELMQEMLAQYPQARIVIISGSERLMDVHRALEAGAQGYINKSVPTDEMRRVLEELLAGARVLPRGYSEERVSALTALTERQIEVLKLLDEGLTNHRIADRLRISPETVKSHLRVLFETLDVNSRTGCIGSARDLGLI